MSIPEQVTEFPKKHWQGVIAMTCIAEKIPLKRRQEASATDCRKLKEAKAEYATLE